jgi:hypothetical protein
MLRKRPLRRGPRRPRKPATALARDVAPVPDLAALARAQARMRAPEWERRRAELAAGGADLTADDRAGDRAGDR